ncbi:hypothetical protein GCM10010156_25950 [Planobispora rosea]|uniref:Lipid droplet-associated protein n=1 Tax=Planobispora rosea TaxID=35762 RepID=A0A8J3RXN2_PLARO|nr:hypothetical protein [Planobispora rosea]GGS65804.1 hypothetical protein GCM10010156_25950 [Planobispora rosea]GIH84956.1 hypothetical protein Pro02_33640 [Planobispora rosea]
MSVPDLFRKAKDLPLQMLQAALSGVGQALLLGDRVRNRIKGAGSTDEELDETRTTAADQLAGSEEKSEEKPARREPVIFAPAKPKTAPAEAAETKPEAPETKTEPGAKTGAKAKTGAETKTGAEPEAAEVKAEAGPAPVALVPAAPVAAGTTPEPITEIATPPAVEVEVAAVDVAEPDQNGAAAVEVVETKPAKPRTTRARTTAGTAKPKSATAKPKAAAGAGAGAAKPKAAKTRKAATTAEATETVETVETVEAVKAGVAAVPAEPLPGYAELTVASLRARMRGKSAEQIKELIEYEKATSARPEVVRMYENRLTKIETAE